MVVNVCRWWLMVIDGGQCLPMVTNGDRWWSLLADTGRNIRACIISDLLFVGLLSVGSSVNRVRRGLLIISDLPFVGLLSVGSSVNWARKGLRIISDLPLRAFYMMVFLLIRLVYDKRFPDYGILYVWQAWKTNIFFVSDLSFRTILSVTCF